MTYSNSKRQAGSLGEAHSGCALCYLLAPWNYCSSSPVLPLGAACHRPSVHTSPTCRQVAGLVGIALVGRKQARVVALLHHAEQQLGLVHLPGLLAQLPAAVQDLRDLHHRACPAQQLPQVLASCTSPCSQGAVKERSGNESADPGSSPGLSPGSG